MHARQTTNRKLHRLGLATIASGSLVFAFIAGGCDNGAQGAFSGAALGALAGMGIGSLSGDMGKGAAAGAIGGGVVGAVIGDQNNRNDRRGSYSNNEW